MLTSTIKVHNCNVKVNSSTVTIVNIILGPHRLHYKVSKWKLYDDGPHPTLLSLLSIQDQEPQHHVNRTFC